MAQIQNEDWCTCAECKKYYARPLNEIHLRTDENPLLCPQGHTMTYYPNGATWQRLTGIYYLLESLYITMPKVVSFRQLNYMGHIMRDLKARE